MRVHSIKDLGRALLLGGAFLVPGFACAGEALDRIEIQSVDAENAEIHIRFATPIQLLRFSPTAGKVLRIFIRQTNPLVAETDLMQETVVAPPTDLVPHFTVTYPELTNGLAVVFDTETRWRVRANGDDHTIIITLPALHPAAKTAAVTAPAVTAAPASAPAAAPVAPEPIPAQVAPAPTPTPVPLATEAAPAPAPATGAESAPPALTEEQVEATAKRFMDDGRQALAAKDLPRVVNRLNRTLSLPTNTQTEPAQALIGEVRELTGEIAKAKAEYDLYLKLFPSGPNAAKVKEHLAHLPAITARNVTRAAVPLQAGPAEWTYYGALSQYYYTGKSQIEVITPPPPGQLNFTTDNLSMTDQNALITSVDLNARRRDGIRDTRIVFRDTDTKNFLSKGRSYNRLYSAYVEQSDRSIGYTVRAGRQNPIGGGILSRFDGIYGNYLFADGWRANAVAGEPVEFMSPYKRQFVGVSVDRLAQPEQIGFSPYLVEQRMDGKTDRRAVGTEVRYFTSQASAFGMLDYDTVYRDLNIVMLQGNYRADAGTNYFTYFDHRKTPPLSLTNAIAGIPGMSIKDAITTLGLEQVRADAKALTAMSDMLAIGFTLPFSQRWMLGADYRAARISGTEAAGVMPATQGSGVNHVISGQAIGNNLWLDNDVGVVNTSLVIGQNYTGEALGVNYVFVRGDPWRFDTNLRFYHQKDDTGQIQNRLSPSFKVAYRWKTVTLECEVGAEDVRNHGPLRQETSTRSYLYLGYRWELR